MNKQTLTTLAVLGGALALVGLVLGLVPLSENGYACGSAFAPDKSASLYAALDGADSISTCADTVASRRGLALALLIPGAVVALGALVWAANLKTPQRQEVA